jgi:CBS domain-containing protein
MRLPLTSMEQLVPFATAGELVAQKSQPLVSIEPATTLFAAMQRMAEAHVGLVVVLESGRLAGVVSERDCARAVVLGAIDAKRTPVSAVMTTQVHTCPPESKIPECVTLMHEKSIGHLPVVAGGQVQGVLSVRDLMGALIVRHERLLRRLHEERLTLLFPDPSSY